MLHDYGSRDAHFIAINKRIREQLLVIIEGEEDFVAVPLQGSGTFSVEAMITTFLPRDGKLLVLVNGAYGSRIVKICQVAGLPFTTLEWPEDRPVDPGQVDAALAQDAAISHVAIIHCETTSGILNPLKEVADVVARHGRRLLIDSMSAFGALPVSAKELQFDAVAASSNKCLEGVPGMGFVLARRSALQACQGNCRALTLDLYDQWVAMEKTKQWRFTPPTHCIVAFDQAVTEFVAEGGVAGRGGRYRENCRLLVDGMRALGFQTLLPDALQAPIIVTFHQPGDDKFSFQDFYDRLRACGYVIYPGKLTVADSFRIGCIGRLGGAEIRGALAAIKEILAETGVTQTAPAA
jgi:2-aminoethylphosphonate-pyruvate transaminase|tara:strand:- start:1502 stop:2554 length:1053 start_codon:yes stop_codon:yes gene_type:complete